MPQTIWQSVWPFGAAYALSYGLRTINGVLAPELTAAFSLSAADLGLLSSAYLLTFALMQLPVGLLLDRYGPRRVESGLLLFAIAGCLVSAMASEFWQLWIGRALIGVGVSACLMASYKFYRIWFDQRLQAPLASSMLVIGSAGALCATLPVQWALALMSWQDIFVWLALAFGLAFLAIRFALPADSIVRSDDAPSLLRDAMDGLAQLTRAPIFWRMLPFGLLSYGGLLAMHSLWVAPWLSRVDGAGQAQAALGLFVVTATVLLSHLGTAALSVRVQRWGWELPRLMHTGLVGMAIATLALMVAPVGWALYCWILVFLFGGVTTLAYTRFASAFPIALSGRATTGFNFLIFIGAFAVQWGLGLAIDGFMAFGSEESLAMRMGIGLWLIAQVASLLWLTRSQADPGRA